MKLKRLFLGLKSFGRAKELLACLKESKCPIKETLAYLQIKALSYPYDLELKSGVVIRLFDWQDLTTAWVVFYGEEYALHHSDKVIVDCDANIGAFSLHCAVALPDARIIALEPFPSTYERLVAGVQKNGFAEKISTLNAAVVGKPGRVYMDDSLEIASHSRKIGGDKGVPVEGYTLENVFDQNALEEVDLLKVDIEGAEYSLFEHAPNQVLRRIKRIGLEYHGNGDTKVLFQRIEAAGFTVGRYPKRGTCGVVEFIRKDKLES